MSESGKITIIANNIKGNASSQIRYDAKKISNTSGGTFTQNGKGSGLNHVNNTKPKEAVGIKITKLEGPFDEKGKLVKKVKAGELYMFKATPSRKPMDVEILALKWAKKADDKELYQVKGAGVHNRLIAGKIVIMLRMPAMEEKCRIYAFYEKPVEGISVEAPLVKILREVYLTFDDGIQAGTEEVLALLKEKGIKATFFLTGVHLWYAFSYHEEKAKKILKDIYENHIIGNHSYSHANDHYSSFYRDGGVKIDNKNERLSVENDFEKNKNQINYYLEKVYGTKFNNPLPLAKNQKKALARFPGTNTWYVNEELKDIKKTDRGHTFELSKKDTAEEAEVLYKKGYKIYGWDVEWNMSFNFHEDAISLEKKKKIDYSKWEETHPYFDMYSKENISKDRENKTWEKVRDEILDYAYDNPLTPTDKVAKTEGKVIVLMHERAFRKGKLTNGNVDLSNSDELNKLKKLIDYFLTIKADFKTLEDY